MADEGQPSKVIFLSRYRTGNGNTVAVSGGLFGEHGVTQVVKDKEQLVLERPEDPSSKSVLPPPS